MFPLLQSGRCVAAAPSAVCVCLYDGGVGDKTQLEEETLAGRSNSAVDPDGGQQEALFFVCFFYQLVDKCSEKPFNTHSFNEGEGPPVSARTP